MLSIRSREGNTMSEASQPMEQIQVPADVLRVMERLARIRNTSIQGILAEAIGLEEAFVENKRQGRPMGVLVGSHFSEIIPLLDQTPDQEPYQRSWWRGSRGQP
jgi:hypothetical protein